MSRLRGVFSESRKVLPHSLVRPFGRELRTERQLGSRTLLSTAPKDGRLRGGSLPRPPSRAAQARRAGLPALGP